MNLMVKGHLQNDRYSPLASYLLQGMLGQDPQERITAKIGVINHWCWTKGRTDTDSLSKNTIVTDDALAKSFKIMLDFCLRCNILHFCFSSFVLDNVLDQKQIDSLMEIFCYINTSNDGLITL